MKPLVIFVKTFYSNSMISALAITFNEEQHIERYIKSLSFAEEIIIVDSFSTDKTVEIAKVLGAKVVQRTFDNFSNQRNYALRLAKNNWVTFFDLDEEISTDLANEISTKLTSKNDMKAYSVKRHFNFMGKRIRYSGFQTDYAVRLFDKRYCIYNEALVHETIKTEGLTGKLKHPVNHLTYKNFDNYTEKLSQYSNLQAKALYNKNLRPNLYHFLFKPWYRFVYNYFFRLGFLDGKIGFILCYLNAFYVFKRYLKLWTMYRDID